MADYSFLYNELLKMVKAYDSSDKGKAENIGKSINIIIQNETSELRKTHLVQEYLHHSNLTKSFKIKSRGHSCKIPKKVR